MFAKRAATSSTRRDYVLKKYTSELNRLKPIARVKLDGVSLVVKYARERPNLVVTADGEGNIYIVDALRAFDLPPSKSQQIEEIEPEVKYQTQPLPIFDIDWHDRSTKLITGSGDLACAVWDVETNNKLYQGVSHTRSVRSVKSCDTNPNLFLSGGRDGQLLIWDTRQRLDPSMVNEDTTLVSDISGTLIEQGKEEIESFTGISFYHDEKTVLSVQANDNYIKVWDLRKLKPEKGTKKKKKIKSSTENPCFLMRIDKTLASQNMILQITNKINEFVQKENKSKEDVQNLWALYEKLKKINEETTKEELMKGFSSLYLSRGHDKLLVNQLCHAQQLYCTDYIQKDPPKIFKGHKSSLYVRSVLSPCNNFIATGSADQAIHIWNVNGSTNTPINSLYSGHFADVNAVDWSSLNCNFLSSVGDDQYLVLWDYGIVTDSK